MAQKSHDNYATFAIVRFVFKALYRVDFQSLQFNAIYFFYVISGSCKRGRVSKSWVRLGVVSFRRVSRQLATVRIGSKRPLMPLCVRGPITTLPPKIKICRRHMT
jgi:hypothetical protein